MIQRSNRFIASLLQVIVIVAFGATVANAEPSDETTLQEYARMSIDDQTVVILDAKRQVFREHLATDKVRAECIAYLFNDSSEGDEQWRQLKRILRVATQRQSSHSAEEITSAVIQQQMCPPSP